MNSLKSTKYILLVVGLIGTGVSIYKIYSEKEFGNNGLTFLCGLSLLYGYLEIDKITRSKEDKK